MKKLLIYLLPVFLVSCGEKPEKTENTPPEISYENKNPEEAIEDVLEQWHTAAGKADFESYFSLMAEDAVFIGTDPTENWHKPDFKEWSKPYFDQGQAWDFTSLERNIFTAETGETAWFDELLDTQMGICRGSGVLVKENGEWKIKHYVLSIAIPNENVSEVTELKKEFDNNLISKLKSK